MVHRITNTVFFSLLLLFLSLSSCYYDKEDLLYGEQVCDTSNISYSQIIEPMIVSKCATIGCHTANGGANGIFESYANVKAKVDNGSFENRVINLRDMPPGGSLDDCQISLFQAWLAAGAPNN